ncbi:helix-turn-helix transcriptional regulator [Enterovibrio nigricans]|uniref:DNA-binding transcriptional regulator, XRE-family HTH domain n=1 Tax=Enterovibrio nigricans DSM 22720 TaxID=1121868 RepID=A0A1T4UDC4_9GAMM|nr:helix-turn-helix transcriptional regulator [Enterovibrio nigricans]SKA50590.1 DNA-binding transcriptional regulator, XRE-family HTH domain [Enterovibrio nigricans DSM 22720]
MDMELSKKKIANKIRTAREMAHKTQVFMAKELNIARQTYLDIENGKTAAKTTTLMEIAEITKMPIMWFLEDVRDHDDYQSVRDSKDVMDFMMILSKLPESARIELLKNSTQMASMMVSYSNKFANERDVYNPMGLCVVN